MEIINLQATEIYGVYVKEDIGHTKGKEIKYMFVPSEIKPIFLGATYNEESEYTEEYHVIQQDGKKVLLIQANDNQNYPRPDCYFEGYRLEKCLLNNEEYEEHIESKNT